MFDFTPLYRSSIGFDHLARMLDDAASFETPAYPPYNIERVGEDEYRITIAIAGFGATDINLEVKGNALTVSGRKAEKEEDQSGIPAPGYRRARGFERRYQLADHVEVTGADLNNGLLHISLKREIPKTMKPRTIAIRSANEQKVLETKKAA